MRIVGVTYGKLKTRLKVNGNLKTVGEWVRKVTIWLRINRKIKQLTESILQTPRVT